MKVCICNDVDSDHLFREIRNIIHDEIRECNIANPKELIAADRAAKLVMAALKERTKASTCCGACTQHIEGMIDSMYEEHIKRGNK